MSNLNGSYEIVAVTPMGDQKMATTIETNGDTFTGRSEGAMGSSDITGSVDGNKLTWKQDITVPMPLTLECEATIDGDTLSGKIDTGSFGTFPISGKKIG